MIHAPPLHKWRKRIKVQHLWCKEVWLCKSISANHRPTSKANPSCGWKKHPTEFTNPARIFWNGRGNLWTQCATFSSKKVRHKCHNVEPIVVSNTPKEILDRYKNFTLCCDLMHTNGIVFLNYIYQHILFATGSMIKNLKVKNIEDGIKQVNKLYLQRGFKITCIHADSEFELLQV